MHQSESHVLIPYFSLFYLGHLVMLLFKLISNIHLQADDISGFHSNTHIPIVVGSQRRYEITGEPLYKVRL